MPENILDVKNTNMQDNTPQEPLPIPPIAPVKKRGMSKFFILTILVLCVGMSAFFIYTLNPLKYINSKNTPIETVQTPPPLDRTTLNTTGGLSGISPNFATFTEDTAVVAAQVPDYTLTAADLPNLTNVEQAYKPLSPGQKGALSSPGFFLTAAPNTLAQGDVELEFRHGGLVDEFLKLYSGLAGDSAPEKRKPENAVFITSDLLLHVYHVFVDRTFQYIEETSFHPKLLTLTTLLYTQAKLEMAKQTDPVIKQSFERLTAFFLIPKVLLEASSANPETSGTGPNPSDVEDASTKAKTADEGADTKEAIQTALKKYQQDVNAALYASIEKEMALISSADAATPSPVYGKYKNGDSEDYTQYKPRSHYTKNSLLRSYWRAMIWYGRFGFLVKSDELTHDAIYLAMLLSSIKNNTETGMKLWEHIYLPTVFFVGKSDDLTIYDYQQLITDVWGSNAQIASINDQTKFASFKEKLKSLKGPQIMSSIINIVTDGTDKEKLQEETKSFRFMGQRFIPDSYIFSSLTQGDEAPDPETGQKLPPIPTALMPMSIFGSTKATEYLKTWITKNAPDSDKVIAKNMTKLNGEFTKLTTKDWTQNLYWSWLYVLKTMFSPFAAGYPKFMQSPSWLDKGLLTSLGSWTELRHDTLLYAKQSYAEMGGGSEPPTPPPVPKGYVEPNIAFLNRLIALVKMTKTGLTTTGVMPKEQDDKIDKLVDTLTFYKSIAVKELGNQKISDDEFEKLRNSYIQLNYPLIPPGDALSYMQAKDARSGLIADVHTAMTAKAQAILYEATGIPQYIYVAVKDANGTRLTRGVVYTQYEFTRPFDVRVNDQDWQSVIYEQSNKFPIPTTYDWAKQLAK
jgi:hypothetical protein